MRVILGVVLAAGLATSAAAQQQQLVTVSPQWQGGNEGRGYPSASDIVPYDLRDNYDRDLFLLKKQIDRQTRKDGGQLTLEHQAKLQERLDQINRSHKRGVRLASR